MDAAKRKRRLLRRSFNSLYEDLEALLEREVLDQEQISVKFKMLIEAFEQSQKEDSTILELMLTLTMTEEEENQEFDEMCRYKERAENMRLKKEKVVPSVSSNASEASCSGGSVTEYRGRNYKLPTIQLKQFGGKLDEWLGFWAQFKKIHEDETLHAADKFQYLMQSLVPGKEPFEIAQGYPQSAENYPKLVEALIKRYGDEDKQLQVHLRKLLLLVTSNANTKEKISVETLFHKLNAHLGALKTLKLEKADPDSWLYPLVESSLPEAVLYNWERSALSTHDGSADNPPRTRLQLLMSFLEREVDIRQRIQISKSFSQEPTKAVRSNTEKKPVPTLTSCHIGEKEKCRFCNWSNHTTVDCRRAQTMPYDRKVQILREHSLCFRCCESHWPFNPCPKENLKCNQCQGRHILAMCKKSSTDWDKEPPPKKTDPGKGPPQKRRKLEVNRTQTSSNVECTAKIALQTLMVKIKSGLQTKVVRAFIDGGSQRSYILKSTAEKMCLTAKGCERVVHALFGGRETEAVTHPIYKLTLEAIDGNYTFDGEFRSNDKLCGGIPRIANKAPEILEELDVHEIKLCDVGPGTPPIELLIGADLCGRIRSNKSFDLSAGGVAVHTKLGWTLLGNVGKAQENNVANLLLSMTIADASIAQLWELDVLGIKDPPEKVNEELANQQLMKRFQDLISREEDGRYRVKLPWKESHPPVPENKDVAFKRLKGASRKLTESALFETYDALFKDWVKENFIEEVSQTDGEKPKHFIPHRPVVKLESLTTPVRPVFDASSHGKGLPSLNDCLETGANCILKIPEVLLRFREKKIGFTADIRKAFQMIAIDISDRAYLCFLWWKDKTMTELMVYRHKVLMFGATCSPSILGAVIAKHLSNAPDEDKEVAQQLLETLYVDNVLNSVDEEKEYESFREKAVKLFMDAKMDLRLWQSSFDCLENDDDESSIKTAVLGYTWNRKTDCLSLKLKKWEIPTKVTKKVVLSCVQKVYDPMGFVSPAVLPMKLLLQKAAINKMKWEQELPAEEIAVFIKWTNEILALDKVQLPRAASFGVSDRAKWSIHTFTDASKHAYAAAVFLRVETENGIEVQLLMAKARVAPIAKVSIPRLELLGCLIGARLAYAVRAALKIEGVKEYFWTDSSTALAWIKRNDQWKAFVSNRTKEIEALTNPEDWRHVPGSKNPADLPSRGCSPIQLVQSRWWEGPDWLRNEENEWPLSAEQPQEDSVLIEKNCTSVALCNKETFSVFERLSKEYKFDAVVRIIAWVCRFSANCRKKYPVERMNGNPDVSELRNARKCLFKNIQQVTFTKERMKDLTGLHIIEDNEGLLRVKTRLTYRDDPISFKYPILLPGNAPEVKLLIRDWHEYYCHPPIGSLQVKLRRRYWIVKQKKAILSVTSKCLKCRRLAATPLMPEPAPLPLDRIKDAEPFETTGIDAGGPFILRNGKKAWFVIFTCAVYRAVHFQLVSAMSARAFVNALEKFIEKYRRPSVIYCDNGTNFRGTDNLFRHMDWERITQEKGVSNITFKFNPATASWWGGFWERLIRTAKDMLKRTLGSRAVNYVELEKILVTIADVMNDRPLTHVSEDPEDLAPLTPSHFLRPLGCASFPEKEELDARDMRYRYRYVKQLKEELSGRFRSEYLAFLVNRVTQKVTRLPKVGELVLVGDDHKKRINWPLGRILELIYSKDGECRLVKVKTAQGEWCRPLQRIFPLELDGENKSRKLTDIDERPIKDL